MPIVRYRGLASLALLVPLVVLAAAPLRAQKGKTPCSPRVSPIRNTRIVVRYDISYSYHPKDESGARDDDIEHITDELNALGELDGNKFVAQDGEQANFTIRLTATEDNGAFGLNGTLNGWGQGFISDVGSGGIPFRSPEKMWAAVAKNIYSWLHNGWHDPRPGCGGER
jgi:hypothetical protein